MINMNINDIKEISEELNMDCSEIERIIASLENS